MSDSPSGSRVACVLFLSGGLGFCLGFFGYPTWQLAIESAQVVAGIVHYPRENPFYIYHTGVWTLLNQIPALLLHLGFSEKTLSLLLSGLMGTVFFQAVALCVLALSDDLPLSTLSPLFLFCAGAAVEGLTYGIALMGVSNTHGAFGLSFALLAVAFIAVRQHKLGCLLLGIAPAIHPPLGLWVTLIVFICLMWDYRSLRNFFRENLPSLLLGYSVSAISLAFHLLVTYDVPKIDANVVSLYLSAFVRHWDTHRRTFPLFSPRVFAILFSLFMSLLWLLVLRRDLPKSSLFLLRSFVVSALLGGALTAVHWLPPEKVPGILLISMPARLLNFNTLGLSILLLGLLGRYGNNFWARLNLITLVVIVIVMVFLPLRRSVFWALFLAGIELVWTVIYLRSHECENAHSLRPLFILKGLLFMMCGVSLLSMKSQNPIFFGKYSTARLLSISILGSAGITLSLFPDFFSTKMMPLLQGGFNRMRLMRMMRFATGLIVMAVGLKSYLDSEYRKNPLRDWTNDPLFAEASKAQGLLLIGPHMDLIQLRTRRPVLLQHELDLLPYALEAGPEMNRILRQVYGIDLLYPPEEVKKIHPGVLLEEPTKTLWERRGPDEWREIKKQFNVTHIVTHVYWKLRLPEVIRNGEFVLYQIP